MANQKKIEEVRILTEKIKLSKAIIMLDYKGIDCIKLNKLRKSVSSNEGTEYLVAKNRLFKIALKDAKIEDNFDKILKGPTSFILSYEDVMKAPRISKEFINESSFIKIKGGLIESKFVDVTLIERLSSIPSKEILIAQLVAVMYSPLTRLSNILKQLPKSHE